MELAAVAPLAFAAGVLVGLGLSSRYLIVRRPPSPGGAVETPTPAPPEPTPEPTPEPKPEDEPVPPRES